MNEPRDTDIPAGPVSDTLVDEPAPDSHEQMAELVDRSANLNWMIDQGQKPAGRPAQAAAWADGPTGPPFDPRTANRWPYNLPQRDYCYRLLVARAVGSPLPANVDENTLTATWKTLTNSEIQALWAVGESGSDRPPSPTDHILAQVAPFRLRARTAIRQADEMHSLDRRVEVDQDVVETLKEELDTAARDSLDPLFREASRGDAEVVKDGANVRKDLFFAQQELDRAVARLRGLPEPKMKVPPGVVTPAKKTTGTSDSGGVSEVRRARSQGLGASLGKGVVAVAVLGGVVYLFAKDFVGAEVHSILAPEPPAAEAAPAAPSAPPPAPTPSVAGVASAPVAPKAPASAPALTPKEQECARQAGALRDVEPGALHVYGTLVMKDNSTAVIADYARREQVARLGDHIGSHCWRVSAIDFDSITLAMDGATGKTLHIPVTAEPAPVNKPHHR